MSACQRVRSRCAGGVGRPQDSMPRAALLSLHARVDRVESSTWRYPRSPSCGPRYNTYVVAKRDFALSLGEFR